MSRRGRAKAAGTGAFAVELSATAAAALAAPTPVWIAVAVIGGLLAIYAVWQWQALGEEVEESGGGSVVSPASGGIAAGGNVDTGHGDFRGNVITDSTVTFVAEPVADNPPARQIVDVTARYLVGLFEGQTDIQAHKLTEAFNGKWMKLSGRLGNVGKWVGGSEDGFCQVTFERAPLSDAQSSADFHQVFMFFRDREYVENRLAVLKIGDQLTVVGQIERVDAVSVALDNCELVD